MWNQVDVTLALELGLLVAGGALYEGITVPRADAKGAAGAKGVTLMVGVVLVGLTIATPFLPALADSVSFGAQALIVYTVLALLAEWMDRSREVVPVARGALARA